MKRYILGIDQSTQATKVIAFDPNGCVCGSVNVRHKQYVSNGNWVEHDAEEIYCNLLSAVRQLMEQCFIDEAEIAGIGLCNQRETVVAWNRKTGKPLCRAIVWQDSRAEEQCNAIHPRIKNEIYLHTGLRVSAYFSAAKCGWIMENIPDASKLAQSGDLCFGTIDTWLLFCMTDGESFCTEYSNASRTQLFNIYDLCWDDMACEAFHVPRSALPEVLDSQSRFGVTTLSGVFSSPVPICSMIGDSQGALYGHGCTEDGMTKVTYGTGSSVMMFTGTKSYASTHGLVTSIAWGIGGNVSYVLEGNINYSAATLNWLKEIGVFQEDAAIDGMAATARKTDEVYIVPAFSGIGAPHWKPNAKALICGITADTGKKELVRAGVESIAFQVCDVLAAMEKDTAISLKEIRCDGGATKGTYLMQFQADLSNVQLGVSRFGEMSCWGAAKLAAAELGFEGFFSCVLETTHYVAQMNDTERQKRLSGWMDALKKT